MWGCGERIEFITCMSACGGGRDIGMLCVFEFVEVESRCMLVVVIMCQNGVETMRFSKEFPHRDSNPGRVGESHVS